MVGLEEPVEIVEVCPSTTAFLGRRSQRRDLGERPAWRPAAALRVRDADEAVADDDEAALLAGPESVGCPGSPPERAGRHCGRTI
jgi:hypothetical protein